MLKEFISRVFQEDPKPVLDRVQPELRQMLFDAQPGEFYDTADTVNDLLELSGEKSLTRQEMEDAWQVHYLRHPKHYR